MTLLESKAVRDGRGIDTFERGFVYAALALRASNTNPANAASGRANRYFNAVRVIADLTARSGDAIEPVLRIDAKLPYHSQLALLFGGNFAKSIESYGNIDPGLSIKCAPSDPNYLLILEEPSWVNSLEKYLVWCGHNLMEGHIALGSNPIPITSNFIDEDSLEPSLIITAALKFDLITYLNGNSIIAAIKSQIIAATDPQVEAVNTDVMSTSSLLLAGLSQVVADIYSSSTVTITYQDKSTSTMTSQITGVNSNNLFKLSGSSVGVLFDANVISFSSGTNIIRGISNAVLTDGNITSNNNIVKFSFQGNSSEETTVDALSVQSTSKLHLRGSSTAVNDKNSAEGKLYTASQSTVYAGTTATTYGVLNDKNGATGSATNPGSPSFIKAVFSNKVLVQGVKVAGGNVSGFGTAAFYLNGAFIDYSLDDITWIKVVDISGVTNSGATQFKTFLLSSPVSAKYWRLRRDGNLVTTELTFI